MARAKIHKDGDAVVLKLNFDEAAAIHALLCRVGPETNEAIHDDTYSTWTSLEDLKSELSGGLWPDDHADFLSCPSWLIDPQEESQ